MEDSVLVGAAQAGGQSVVENAEDDEGAHGPEPEEHGEAAGEEEGGDEDDEGETGPEEHECEGEQRCEDDGREDEGCE